MTSERSLTVDGAGKVTYSPKLISEINDWLLSEIFGKTRPEATAYLLGQTRMAASDGVECAYSRDPYTNPYEGIYQRPTGSCLCARLLMLLHDVSEEEISREMFTQLIALLGKEEKK